MAPKKTIEQFAIEANPIHGEKYNYIKFIYLNGRTYVVIECPIDDHGIFGQRTDSHLDGKGCLKCADARKSQEQFEIDGHFIHNNKYDYSLVKYKNAHTDVDIICPVKDHGKFSQDPHHHINRKQGCPKCGGSCQKSKEEFEAEANIIHENKYINGYGKVEYINVDTHVIIKCPVENHPDFEQTPWHHLQGQGCPKCSPKKYSKAQIEWLELIMRYLNIYIQHIKNEGEHSIVNSQYSADGYYNPLKIIFEYHGCFWHGCPICYIDRELICPKSTKTYQQLYDNTLSRQKCCEDNGYFYICIWECEYNKLKRDFKLLANYILDIIILINKEGFRQTDNQEHISLNAFGFDEKTKSEIVCGILN